MTTKRLTRSGPIAYALLVVVLLASVFPPAWVVGTVGVLFGAWEVTRRLRAGAAHIRHCIDTFEPGPYEKPHLPGDLSSAADRATRTRDSS